LDLVVDLDGDGNMDISRFVTTLEAEY